MTCPHEDGDLLRRPQHDDNHCIRGLNKKSGILYVTCVTINAHSRYRTKRLILECYDAMQQAIDTGEPYQTVLDPPPGHGPRHPERTTVGP